VILAHVCICCGEIILEIQSFRLNVTWQQKSSEEIVKCLQKDEMFCFRVENKRLFYLVEIQYCYALILSERMNREIEEKKVIQSRKIQRGKGYYGQCIHPGSFNKE
jgi:hypothetical protein